MQTGMDAFNAYMDSGRHKTDLDIMYKLVEYMPNLTDHEYARELHWGHMRAARALSDLKCKNGVVKFGPMTRHCTYRGQEKPRVHTWMIDDRSETPEICFQKELF